MNSARILSGGWGLDVSDIAGIRRVDIRDGWSDADNWRVKLARECAPAIDELLRGTFQRLGLALAAGSVLLQTTRETELGKLDQQRGVDVVLTTTDNRYLFVQEKVLTYSRENTVTFELEKTTGEPGAWYYCHADFYLVVYVNRETRELRDWILLNLPAVRVADGLGLITWRRNRNRRDGRGATFQYANFADFPAWCVVAINGDIPLLLLSPAERGQEAELRELEHAAEAGVAPEMAAWGARLDPQWGAAYFVSEVLARRLNMPPDELSALYRRCAGKPRPVVLQEEV